MAYPLLDRIDSPEDLRRFRESELKQLAPELRRFIIDIVSEKEGHLGASLGVVELTIALHYVFQTPEDLLVWDVGHQAYGHKILTGRKNVFHTNRDLGGISGFPKCSESVYDTFGVGHSSTSISAALGMAMASALKNERRKHVAVIGDASIASGMAFEALNHAGVSNADLLVILNDNAIGIDPSVGALKQYLTRTKSGKETGQENLFEALNFDYYGPIDGHNFDALLSELERQKNLEGPRLLHVRTTKGKGLRQAERDQVKYHAPGRFDKITGDLPPKDGEVLPQKYQEVFGETILELAKSNEKIVGITPAMPTGSSLKIMMDAMPDRAFDVGIAEQHAVTLAAGMATQGLVPFCTIYSTFLQRAYDQVIHDVALQKLPVIFCLDRAGLVGKDGATHHGVFDLAYLNLIPNLIIAAPMSAIELRNLMFTASQGLERPFAMRYPRGRCDTLDWKKPFESIPIGKSRLLSSGSEIAIISIGTIGLMVQELIEAEKLDITHLDARFLKPLDEQAIDEIFSTHKHVITIEDGTEIGGLGDAVLSLVSRFSFKGTVHKIGIPDQFIEHGPTADLHKMAGIDQESLLSKIKSIS